ncbi:MAG: aminoacyl-tRNA hydrolase, partial [Gemmatimonadetes bacterium]|nr:aminoacyl-tRNA hydrolase [Gemmatimonadota bacterium]
MKVIVGLGNPGREYAGTRHNVGWWVIDHLADVWRFDGWKKDHEALVASGTVEGAKVRLVKPQTYMNESGAAVRHYARRPFFAV